MANNIIKKRAGEKLLVGADFSADMGDDATILGITSVDSEMCSGETSDLVITEETVSGQSAIFYVDGGTAGIRYNVIITITTSEGETLIIEGILVVE